MPADEISAWLAELEAHVGGRVVQEAGMRFGDMHTWWSDRKMRPRPHEGVDVATFVSTQSVVFGVGTTPIRAVEDGVVVACFSDFLGTTIIVRCNRDQHDQFCWLYAHLHLLDEQRMQPGCRIERREILGHAAATLKRCPPHLHLSLLRIKKEPVPWSEISWETIHATSAVEFEPLALPSSSDEASAIGGTKAVPVVRVQTDGVLSPHVAALNMEVFGTPIDCNAWQQRMQPGRSYILSTTHGFLAAHERGAGVVNVWLMGVASRARGRGHFHALVLGLLCEVGMAAQLTMTTRPDVFTKMFGILSTFARRGEEAGGDVGAGKARFTLPAWWAWLMLLRRRMLLLLGVGAAAVCGAAAVLNKSRHGARRLRG